MTKKSAWNVVKTKKKERNMCERKTNDVENRENVKLDKNERAYSLARSLSLCTYLCSIPMHCPSLPWIHGVCVFFLSKSWLFTHVFVLNFQFKWSLPIHGNYINRTFIATDPQHLTADRAENVRKRLDSEPKNNNESN